MLYKWKGHDPWCADFEESYWSVGKGAQVELWGWGGGVNGF